MNGYSNKDGDGLPKIEANSKGRKRRPGSKSLGFAVKSCDANLLSFLGKCLTWDHEKRITADEALQHPFITSRDQKRELLRFAGAKSVPKLQVANIYESKPMYTRSSTHATLVNDSVSKWSARNEIVKERAMQSLEERMGRILPPIADASLVHRGKKVPALNQGKEGKLPLWR